MYGFCPNLVVCGGNPDDRNKSYKNNLPAVEDKMSSQTIVKILAQCMQQGKDSYRTNHVKNL